MIPGIVAQQARMNEAGADYAAFGVNYKHANITLSNDNLTAENTAAAGFNIVGVLDAKITGQWYFEVTLEEFGTANDEIIIGVGTYEAALNDYIGRYSSSMGYAWDGRIIYNNANLGSTPGTFTEGDVIGIEVDAATRTVKFRKNGGAWSTKTNLSGGTQPLMPLVQLYRVGARVTINTGQSPWHTNPESGYVGWTVNEPVAARYWRYFTNAAPVTPGLAHIVEFELRETFGGATVATGGTATADQNHDGSTVPANAFDGNLATYWGTTFNSTLPHWLQYDFGSGNDKLITEVLLRTRADTNQGQPADTRILYSHDGTIFFPAHGLGRAAWNQGVPYTFRLFDSPSVPQQIVATTDQNYLHTSALITFDGANGTASFTDDSRYAHTISVSGGATVTNNRLVFDGVNDLALTPATTASGPFAFASAFTGEAFGVKFDAPANTRQFLFGFDNQQGIDNAKAWRVVFDGTTNTLAVNVVPSGLNAGTVYTASASFTPIAGREYDIAFSWDGSNLRLYVDGIRLATTALTEGTLIPSTSQSFRIGSQRLSGADTDFFKGHMAAIRLTRAARMVGDTYARNALPLATTSTATTDTLLDKVAFILNGEGADGSTKFRDRSPYDRKIAVFGAAANDTDISVGDTPSILLGTNADYLTGAFSSGLSVAGLDFCYEVMVKHNDATAWQQLLCRRDGSHNFYFAINAGKLRWDYFNGSSAVGTVTGATTLALNTLYHLCVIRDIATNTIYLFVNGVLDASGVYAGSRTEGDIPIYVGHDPSNTARYLRGSINHARMTIGAKRYNTAGFTVPSIPYLNT